METQSVISTGDWIVIGLTIAILVLTMGIAAVTFLMWKRPLTHVRFRKNWFIDIQSHPQYAVVHLVAELAPLGSVMVSEANAWLIRRRRRIELYGLNTHIHEALEGARALGFQFQLNTDLFPMTEHDHIEALIRLIDGAKAKFKRPMNTAIGN